MAESEKSRDMFDTVLQGLKPGLKIVGTVAEEIAKQTTPDVKFVAGRVAQKIATRMRKRAR